MTVTSVPYNIQNHAGALAQGLSRGDRIHVRVSWHPFTKNVVFCKYLENRLGIEGYFEGEPNHWCFCLWKDITELWILEEKSDPYFSDMPEVAEKLKKLKVAIQMCVESDDRAGVLYLLDQVIEVKKAERAFKDSLEVIAIPDKRLNLKQGTMS